MKAHCYKSVLYAQENNKYWLLVLNNGKLGKKFFNTEEEIQKYIDDNERNFI